MECSGYKAIQEVIMGVGIGCGILLVLFGLWAFLMHLDSEFLKREYINKLKDLEIPTKAPGKKIKHKGRWVFRDKKTGEKLIIKDDKVVKND